MRKSYGLDISLPFALGLLVAIPLLGMIVHEWGHFFACNLLGLKVFSLSLTQVVHGVSSNPSVNVAVGFAGGLAQALSSFVLVFVTGFVSTIPIRSNSQIESRLRIWGVSIGLEAAFLTVGFAGLVTAFWEGLFVDSYYYLAGDLLVGVLVEVILTLISALVAFLILFKMFPAPTE